MRRLDAAISSASPVSESSSRALASSRTGAACCVSHHFSSSMRVGTPADAQRWATNSPAGPPPAISTRDSCRRLNTIVTLHITSIPRNLCACPPLRGTSPSGAADRDADPSALTETRARATRAELDERARHGRSASAAPNSQPLRESHNEMPVGRWSERPFRLAKRRTRASRKWLASCERLSASSAFGGALEQSVDIDVVLDLSSEGVQHDLDLALVVQGRCYA